AESGRDRRRLAREPEPSREGAREPGGADQHRPGPGLEAGGHDQLQVGVALGVAHDDRALGSAEPPAPERTERASRHGPRAPRAERVDDVRAAEPEVRVARERRLGDALAGDTEDAVYDR